MEIKVGEIYRRGSRFVTARQITEIADDGSIPCEWLSVTSVPEPGTPVIKFLEWREYKNGKQSESKELVLYLPSFLAWVNKKRKIVIYAGRKE